jgi:hypothetical protein
VTVPSAFLEPLEAGWLHFRGRVIFDFELSEVRAVGRVRGGTTEWWERLATGTGYRAAEGTAGTPDGEALTRALSRLLRIVAASWEADDSTDLSRYGLLGDGTTARIMVRLRRDGEPTSRERSIVIGDEIAGTGAHYARMGEGDAQEDVFVLSSHRDVGGGNVQAVLEALLAPWSR